MVADVPELEPPAKNETLRTISDPKRCSISAPTAAPLISVSSVCEDSPESLESEIPPAAEDVGEPPEEAEAAAAAALPADDASGCDNPKPASTAKQKDAVCPWEDE